MQRRRALDGRRRDASLQRMRARRGAGIGQQHGGGISLGPERRHGRHHALGHLRAAPEAGLRVVEHVPGIRAAGLQRLHVVLDGDHRVGEPVEIVRRNGRATGLQQFVEGFAMPSTISAARALAEHQQAGLDAGDEPGQASSAPTSGVPATFEAMASLTRTRFTLHSRSTAACTCWNSTSTDPATASACGLGNDESDEIAVEAVLDIDERGGDVHQRA